MTTKMNGFPHIQVSYPPREDRGTGVTDEANMRKLRDVVTDSYGKALDMAGVTGANKRTNLESFRSGMIATLKHLERLGIVKVLP
jgi:hypothetical protein